MEVGSEREVLFNLFCRADLHFPPPLPPLNQELAKLEKELGGMTFSRDSSPESLEPVSLPLMVMRAPFRRPSDMFGLPSYAAASTSGRRAGAPLEETAADSDDAALSKLQALLFTSLPVRHQSPFGTDGGQRGAMKGILFGAPNNSRLSSTPQ